MNPKYLEFRKFASDLVVNASKIILEERNNLKIIKEKDLQDIATSADLASEKYIIDRIKDSYPDHSILSEEEGEITNKSKYRWIIDPLDGTKEYVRNLPFYNISVALEYDGELIASALYRPGEKTLFSASKGGGSFKDEFKIVPSVTQSLDKCFIYFYVPSYQRSPESYDMAFEKIKLLGKNVYRLRGMSDENTAMCWVAEGAVDAYINLSDKPKFHDIATGMMIAKESGAIVDTSKYPLIVCANEKIYNQISEII